MPLVGVGNSVCYYGGRIGSIIPAHTTTYCAGNPCAVVLKMRVHSHMIFVHVAQLINWATCVIMMTTTGDALCIVCECTLIFVCVGGNPHV